MSFEWFQFGDEEIQNLMSEVPPPETGNSFTALLELSPNQAVKLLHSPAEATPEVFASVFPAMQTENSLATRSNFNSVKTESIESGHLYDSSPILSDLIISRSTKRREREKKVKSSAKKNKCSAKEIERQKLPYVHVRARRGEATDSHSLAERVRREKINARMKLLQELVPGCNKISGTAMVLDEIINHVQNLQRQVELLSMKLASVHPRIDINLDTLFSSESGSIMDCMVSPSWLLDGRVNGNVQQIWHPDGLLENSLLSYDSLGNSASLLTSQLKMELL